MNNSLIQYVWFVISACLELYMLIIRTKNNLEKVLKIEQKCTRAENFDCCSRVIFDYLC